MSKTIHLIRHGEVQARPNIFLGTTDVDLNQLGKRQSNFLAQHLIETQVDRCFCSPLARAQQTAELIATTAGLKVETDPSLREINFGLWEERTFNEIESADPQQTQQWCNDPLAFTFPNGDSVAEFIQRMRIYMQRLKTTDDQHILLVTHGGVIRILLTLLLQLEPQQQFKFEIGRGSLSTIKLYDNTAILTGLNYGSK